MTEKLLELATNLLETITMRLHEYRLRRALNDSSEQIDQLARTMHVNRRNPRRVAYLTDRRVH